MAVEIGNNGRHTEVFRWTHGAGDDDRWHHEIVDLSRYLQSGFNVRFVTEQSSSVEDVGIDNVLIRGEGGVSECTLVISAELQSDRTILAEWEECDDIRRYKVYASENGGSISYQGSVYSGTSFTLANPTGGSTYEFVIKAQYNETYVYTEYFRSNAVLCPVIDRTAPVISVPDDITVDATSTSGTSVTFSVSAYDETDYGLPVSCTPASGSNFNVGTTTVTCSASDSAGNPAYDRFYVIVRFEVVTPDPEPTCGDSTSDDLRENGLLCLFRDNNYPIGNGVVYGGSDIGLHFIQTNSTGSYADTTLSTATIGASLNTPSGLLHGLIVSGHAMTPELSSSAYAIPNEYITLDGQSTTSVLLSFVGDDTTPSYVNNHFIAHTYLNTYQTSSFDARFIPLIDTITSPENQVKTDDDIVINISSKGGLPDIGSTISILGANTNSDGIVRYNDVTVRDSKQMLTHQSLADYDSIFGDSGAPIIQYNDDGTTHLYGIHVGKLCSTNFDDTEPLPIFINNPQNCTEFKRYNIFSNWDYVVSGLGIE